ncbi:hypothetical protein [Phenylobacterium sp.]|uniref:helix-turn-helix domain-containing protein n=1 Tax=Phenylobacterium sp. TaxID=1871053 RepID=UPI00301D782A
MTVAEAIRAYRARLGWTAETLARHWDVPLSTLRGWEAGKDAGNTGRVLLALIRDHGLA